MHAKLCSLPPRWLCIHLMHILGFATLLGSALLGAAPAAFATTYAWNGNGDDMNWSEGANWQGGVTPVDNSFDTVLTFSGSSPYPLHDGGPFELNGLVFGGTSSSFVIGSPPSTNSSITKGDGPLEFSTNFKGGDPSLTLNGNSGTVTINDAIVLDATLMINGSSDGIALTLGGVISGAGGLTMSNVGTATLSGANTYTGGTTVQAGTLVASNNGNALSTGTVAIGSGATVALSNSSTSTTVSQAGAITFSGAGTLQKLGAGTVQLGGNGGAVNVSLSAGGLIDVEAGTLKGSSSYQGNYANNLGGLNIATGATFDGVEGTIRVDALTGAGTLQGGYNYGAAGSTTLGVNNGSGTFTGVIQDSNDLGGTLTLTKVGTGTQTLSGNNTYSGATTISGGTLLVNGTSSGPGAFTVQNSGSVLGGTGTISAAVSVTTGTLNPGGNAGANGSAANVGKLTVGALTLSSTATSIFDLASGTTYDQLFANGNITLGGSTLTLNVSSSAKAYTIGQTLDLFHANGGLLTGTFDNFANLGSYTYGGDTFLATYTPTDFTLTVTSVPEPATWLAGALLLAGAGWTLCRRLRRA